MINDRKYLGRALATLAFLALLLTAAACSSGAARSAYSRGEHNSQRELWDNAVLDYAKAVALDPGNSRYKSALARAKLHASAVHFARAKQYLKSGQLELAIEELQETVVLDPSNQYALDELDRAMQQMERRRSGPSDVDLARAEAAEKAKLLGPPKLDPASNIPIVLNFPDSTIERVYESLSKSSGINFIYDEKVQLDKKAEVELSGVSFEKAMDILMLQYKHFYKVIDEHTILIADDTRQKRAEYEDQVIRTFYLSNAETKQVQQLLRSLLETRRISENQDLNAITLKDTPEKIKVAERIIRANDKAKGEVIVDLELLEINRNKIQDLGIDLSSKSLSLVFGDGAQSLTLNALEQIRSKAAWSIGPVPSVVMKFLKSDSDSKSLARPQLRILEGEDGKITIGDRVPIPATTFNSAQTVGGNIVPITSFTYQNVGIIVDVKPRVHHNKEVTLDIKLEISSLAGSVEGSGGVSQPIIGTRTIETVLRLKDGETNLLAGLIKEDERSSLSGIPGLSDVPFLRRLFGSTRDEASVNDIVMSVTPHILRVPNIEPIDLVPLWVGTEEQVKLRGVARNALGESPFGPGESPWSEIEAQLKGPAEEASGKQPAQIKVSGEGGGDDTPAEQRRQQRQPRQPRTPQPQSLPDEGAFGERGPTQLPGDAKRGAAQTPEAAPEKAADEPRRPSVVMVRLASPGRVAVGERVPVQVLVTGAEDVGTVNFQLRYNPQVLRFQPPGQVGPFLQQGGMPVDLQAIEAADGGLVVVSAARAGEQGASGSGTLVTLDFVAVAEGDAGFSFSAAQVRSPTAKAMPASFRRAAVEVVK